MHSYLKTAPKQQPGSLPLLLISDGHVSRSEMDALTDWTSSANSALTPGPSQVLRTLCEDLLMGTHERRVLTGSVNAETPAVERCVQS